MRIRVGSQEPYQRKFRLKPRSSQQTFDRLFNPLNTLPGEPRVRFGVYFEQSGRLASSHA